VLSPPPETRNLLELKTPRAVSPGVQRLASQSPGPVARRIIRLPSAPASCKASSGVKPESALPQLPKNLPEFVPPTFEGPLPIPESPDDSPSGGFGATWGTATASTIVADEELSEKLPTVEENDQAEKEAEVKAKITKMIEESGVCKSQPVSPQFGHAQPQDAIQLIPVSEEDGIIATGPGSEESAPSSVCSYSSSEDDDGDFRSPKGDMRLLSPQTFVDEMASPMPLPEVSFDFSADTSPDPGVVPAPGRLLEFTLNREDAAKLFPQMDTPIDFIDLTPTVLPDSLEPSPQQVSSRKESRFDWSLASTEKVDAYVSKQDPERWLKVGEELKNSSMLISKSVERFGCQEGSTGGCNTPPPRG